MINTESVIQINLSCVIDLDLQNLLDAIFLLHDIQVCNVCKYIATYFTCTNFIIVIPFVLL